MDLKPIVPMAAIARLPASAIPALVAQMFATLADANLYMSQFHLFSVVGDQDFALELQARALQIGSIYRIEGSKSPAIRLLALMGQGAQSANTPLDYLIEGSDIQLDLLYVVPGHPPPSAIPDHDVAIVAQGESDQSQPVLEMMEALTENWPRPVLNLAKSVRRCSRDGVYQLLTDIPGLLIPSTLRFTRDELEKIVRDGGRLPDSRSYPITVRPLISQGGSGLARIDNAVQLTAYLKGSAEQDFYISFYIDYRSADGLYRKARIALIDGQPFICHLAISENWIVHYGSAGMAQSAAKREEEARFMRDFDNDFAARHEVALRAIAQRLALDYVVIDCAETREGDLLVFEADNRSWVHATDPLDVFPYKQEAMRRVFDAFRTMLFKAAQTGHGA